jgi:hypothetical protein
MRWRSCAASITPTSFISLPWLALWPAVSKRSTLRLKRRSSGPSMKVTSWMFSSGMVFSTCTRMPLRKRSAVSPSSHSSRSK